MGKIMMVIKKKKCWVLVVEIPRLKDPVAGGNAVLSLRLMRELGIIYIVKCPLLWYWMSMTDVWPRLLYKWHPHL